MDLTRAQFLRLIAGAGALGLSKLAACGGSDAEPTDAPPGNPDAPAANPDAPPVDAPPVDAPVTGSCQQNGTSIVIGFNHGHAMTVPAADVVAGVEKIYDITGTSDHPHTVVITGAMFAMLRQNVQIMVNSSVDDGHPHPVTIRCA